MVRGVYAPAPRLGRSGCKVHASATACTAAAKPLPCEKGQRDAQPRSLVMFGITELPLVAPGRWARPFETPPALVAARRSHDSEGRRAARDKSARARSKRVRC